MERYQLELILLVLSTKFAQKGYFPVKNRKNKHHQWILHIRVSVGTKFQLKLIILIFFFFGPNLVKTEYFQFKGKKVNFAIDIKGTPTEQDFNYLILII